MTALTLPRPRPNLFPLALIALAALAVVASYHAVMTHGQAALDAQHCFGNGTIQQEVMQDPLTGRTMRFCLEQGKWFISIDAADGSNVTMFPRSFARCLADVIDYAKRSGFTKLLPIFPF